MDNDNNMIYMSIVYSLYIWVNWYIQIMIIVIIQISDLFGDCFPVFKIIWLRLVLLKFSHILSNWYYYYKYLTY